MSCIIMYIIIDIYEFELYYHSIIDLFMQCGRKKKIRTNCCIYIIITQMQINYFFKILYIITLVINIMGYYLLSHIIFTIINTVVFP